MSTQDRPKIYWFKCHKHCPKSNPTGIPFFTRCLIVFLINNFQGKGNVTQLKQHIYAHPHKSTEQRIGRAAYQTCHSNTKETKLSCNFYKF